MGLEVSCRVTGEGGADSGQRESGLTTDDLSVVTTESTSTDPPKLRSTRSVGFSVGTARVTDARKSGRRKLMKRISDRVVEARQATGETGIERVCVVSLVAIRWIEQGNAIWDGLSRGRASRSAALYLVRLDRSRRVNAPRATILQVSPRRSSPDKSRLRARREGVAVASPLFEGYQGAQTARRIELRPCMTSRCGLENGTRT